MTCVFSLIHEIRIHLICGPKSMQYNNMLKSVRVLKKYYINIVLD